MSDLVAPPLLGDDIGGIAELAGHAVSDILSAAGAVPAIVSAVLPAVTSELGGVGDALQDVVATVVPEAVSVLEPIVTPVLSVVEAVTSAIPLPSLDPGAIVSTVTSIVGGLDGGESAVTTTILSSPSSSCITSDSTSVSSTLIDPLQSCNSTDLCSSDCSFPFRGDSGPIPTVLSSDSSVEPLALSTFGVNIQNTISDFATSDLTPQTTSTFIALSSLVSTSLSSLSSSPTLISSTRSVSSISQPSSKDNTHDIPTSTGSPPRNSTATTASPASTGRPPSVPDSTTTDRDKVVGFTSVGVIVAAVAIVWIILLLRRRRRRQSYVDIEKATHDDSSELDFESRGPDDPRNTPTPFAQLSRERSPPPNPHIHTTDTSGALITSLNTSPRDMEKALPSPDDDYEYDRLPTLSFSQGSPPYEAEDHFVNKNASATTSTPGKSRRRKTSGSSAKHKKEGSTDVKRSQSSSSTSTVRTIMSGRTIIADVLSQYRG